MNVNHYIGFDVHKKSISYCVKAADGTILEEDTLPAKRAILRFWARKRTEPWHGAMEATLFSGWIYDTLKPFAAELQMGHPALMKAIAASKKKNDKLDARKIADMVRCDLLPACYVAPVEIARVTADVALPQPGGRPGDAHEEQDERAVDGGGRGVQQAAAAREAVLHGSYWTRLAEVPESVKDLLRLSRGAMEMFETTQEQLLARLKKIRRLSKRVTLLESIRGVGEVTALTWALEVGDPRRFSLRGARGELLRTNFGTSKFGGQTTTGTALETTQCPLTDGVSRSRQTGAAVEPAIGGITRAGSAARESQPGDSGGSTKAGGVSVGGGQIRPAVRECAVLRPPRTEVGTVA